MEDSIKEIDAQKAGEFLNTFYFQYGHKSIADLAHIPMAVENISLLAAIEVVDEQRWDGQERSTRYQDFAKREYYTPPNLSAEDKEFYDAAIHSLFDRYEIVLAAAKKHFSEEHPIPAGMTQVAYERTIAARSFDVARYLLPMATLTSVGQITSARTLEGQISRLLASKYPEVRNLGEKLIEAASNPAHNVNHAKLGAMFTRLEEFGSFHTLGSQVRELIEEIRLTVTRDVASAKTLVKHTLPDSFRTKVRNYAQECLETMPFTKYGGIDHPQDWVESIPPISDPDMEIVSTVLYEHSHLSFRNILCSVGLFGSDWRRQFIKDVLSMRGEHDELPRSFRVGGGLIFDIYMDVGGLRDMHRHRRTTQILQGYQAADFASPSPYLGEDIERTAREAYRQSTDPHHRFASKGCSYGDYLLPLGAKRRILMKMDLAEAVYIAELRTGPAGHISYRYVAWQIYLALKAFNPTVAAGISKRVTDPYSPLDFFKR
jgi:thymidylate synthase ThyX